MVKQKTHELINILVPKTMVSELEVMSAMYDTDRSKLIRNLIRDEWRKIQRRQERQQKLEAQYQNTTPRMK